jgi:hypothetical protein
MKKARKTLAVSAAGLAALAGVAWIGLQIKPAPCPPLAERTPPLKYVPLPDDLPQPVARYLRITVGEQIPVLDTAVISGRATLRFGGIPFPARFRFTYEVGRSYHHNMEATFFGLPLLKADESYIDGAARLVVPFGEQEGSFIFTFDPQTGLMADGIAQRYRDASDQEKIPWRLEPLGWQTFNGMQIPSPASVRWMDQEQPWTVFDLEDVRYNVPVSPPL